jgi:nucleotide sugar dehydrogenase
LVLANSGYSVLGIDISESYVESLNNKSFKSNEPEVNNLLNTTTNFIATTDFEAGLNFSDIYFILVATPTAPGEKAYDHSHLSNLLMKINNKKVENKHIVVGCTVLPGYISHVGRYLIKDCKNTTISYNPEFIAQGEIVKGLWYPDMILIGEGSKEIGDFLEECYKNHTKNTPKICRMSLESAEITKLAINCFITMKISFANQIGDIADKSENANKYEILSAVGEDSRIGKKCILPGYGFGGPCFPRDNRALGGYARSIGLKPLLMEATDEYNNYHSSLMALKLADENRDKYIIEDVAYKPKCAVAIIEESQPLAVAIKLVRLGKRVIIRDREMILNEVKKEYGNLFEYEKIKIDF